MSTMRATLIALLAALLGFAAAGLVACGGEPRGGIEPGRAEDLKDRLQAVRSAVEDGKCERAAAALVRLRADVDRVPPTVRKRLRERLDDGVRALNREAPDECADAASKTKTTTTPTIETPTEAPPESTPAPAPTPTQETTSEETAPTPPPEPVEPTTPPVAPTVPDGTGGISPDGESKGDG